MGKINKEFQWRMEGILHAREVVKKDGLEGLDKEIKMRGFLQAPLVYSKGQIDGWWDELSTNLYATRRKRNEIKEFSKCNESNSDIQGYL